MSVFVCSVVLSTSNYLHRYHLFPLRASALHSAELQSLDIVPIILALKCYCYDNVVDATCYVISAL